MLDLGFVRANFDSVREKMQERGLPDILADFEAQDAKRRKLLSEVEALKARRNKVSDEIARLKKQKQDASELIAQMKEVSVNIQQLDEQAKAADEKLRDLLRRVPNLPHESVPVGRSAQDNQEVRRWASSISNAPPRLPERALRSISGWEPGWNGRWRSSCWIFIPASTDIPKSSRRSW